MPVHKVPGGYRWGTSGKVYKTRVAAERQARAIYASGYRGDARRRAAAQHLSANRAAETRYVVALQRILGQVHAGVLEVVRREGLLTGESERHDAPWARVGLGPALVDRIVRYVTPEVGKAFDRMAAAAAKHTAKGVRKIGLVPITPRGLAGAIAASRERNISLVEKAGRAYADDVRDVLEDPENFGKRHEELAGLLEERGRISARHAAMVARDQTLKLNASLVEHRARAAGVRRYTWSSSRDERVRPMHAELEGEVFSWDEPPVTNEDGDENHPGGDYQCRCVAVPLLEDDEGEGDPDDVAAE